VAKPAVAAVAIFQAAWVWNELPLALVLVRDKAWQVLPVGLLSFQGEHSSDWGVTMAGVTLAMAPILLLYFVFQQHMVKGLTAGAVK
jgi:raffinose/stachyose/melibiose transport system permease protein